MASKKIWLVHIDPKNDAAKAKLEYHGSVWILKDENCSLPYSRNKGKCLVLQSKDGKKILFVSMENDTDFTFRRL